VFSRGQQPQQQQQPVDCGVLMSGELLDKINAVIHQLTSPPASQAQQQQQQQQDVPCHHSAADHTHIAYPSHS